MAEGGDGGTRIGDPERSAVVDLLRAHTSEGRLTLDEFSERVGRTLAATTRADLDELTADLPGRPEPVADTRRRRATRWVLALMGGSSRRGRWRAGERVTVMAVMGGAELDFRRAEIDSDEVVVTVVALMGGVDIVVPEGIDVELTGIPIMGGKQIRVADVPVLPGSPRIRVRAFPIMGGIHVRSRPDRAGTDERFESDGQLGGGPQLVGLPGVTFPPLPPLSRGPGMGAADLGGLQDRLDRHLERIDRQVDRARSRAERRAGGAGGRGVPRSWSPPDPEDLATVPTAPDGTVTILFTDIAGFTAMTERLGDRAVHEVLRRFQGIVRGQLAAYGGHEVKVQGDGFMVAFAGAGRALRCAIAIQRAFDDDAKEQEEPILVHQGLNTGEALRDGGDFVGRTVILASRIAGEARAGEILVSSLLHELAGPTGDFRFGPGRPVELRGVAGVQTVYPVEWGP